MPSFVTLPTLVHSPGQVRGALGSELRSQLAPREHVMSLMVIPADLSAPQAGSWARTRGAQVLAVTERRVVVGAEAIPATMPRWASLSYDELLAWRLEHHLLNGQLHFYGSLSEPRPPVWIEFHTAGQAVIDEVLIPFEHAMVGARRTPEVSQPAPPGAEELPASLANALGRALLPAEIVRAWVFQPLLRARAFRPGPRVLTTPTLAVATDRRLLIMCEVPETHTPRYGRRTWSMPRYRAVNLRVQISGGLVIVEHQPDPRILRVMFARDYLPALQQLIARLQAHQSSSPGQVTQRLAGL
jgi:hypothetical protein